MKTIFTIIMLLLATYVQAQKIEIGLGAGMQMASAPYRDAAFSKNAPEPCYLISTAYRKKHLKIGLMLTMQNPSFKVDYARLKFSSQSLKEHNLEAGETYGSGIYKYGENITCININAEWIFLINKIEPFIGVNGGILLSKNPENKDSYGSSADAYPRNGGTGFDVGAHAGTNIVIYKHIAAFIQIEVNYNRIALINKDYFDFTTSTLFVGLKYKL